MVRGHDARATVGGSISGPAACHNTAGTLRRLRLAETRCDSGRLAAGVVRAGDGRLIGLVDGLLVNPASRSIRFFVVRGTEPEDDSRYLLPFSAVAAHVDTRCACLEIEVSAETFGDWTERAMSPDQYAPFSDDDLVTCLRAVRGREKS